ncbi:MAG: acyl carrier protein [Nannocystaceae bacterium]
MRRAVDERGRREQTPPPAHSSGRGNSPVLGNRRGRPGPARWARLPLTEEPLGPIDLTPSPRPNAAPTRAAITDEIRRLLAGVLRREVAAIDADEELEALGVDSLALIELSVSLEERFGLAMPPAASPSDLGIRTVADVAAFVDERLRSRRGGDR